MRKFVIIIFALIFIATLYYSGLSRIFFTKEAAVFRLNVTPMSKVKAPHEVTDVEISQDEADITQASGAESDRQHASEYEDLYSQALMLLASARSGDEKAQHELSSLLLYCEVNKSNSGFPDFWKSTTKRGLTIPDDVLVNFQKSWSECALVNQNVSHFYPDGLADDERVFYWERESAKGGNISAKVAVMLDEYNESKNSKKMDPRALYEVIKMGVASRQTDALLAIADFSDNAVSRFAIYSAYCQNVDCGAYSKNGFVNLTVGSICLGETAQASFEECFRSRKLPDVFFVEALREAGDIGALHSRVNEIKQKLRNGNSFGIGFDYLVKEK